MSKSDIAGRFWLEGDIYNNVVTVKTSFDATKATPEELRHIEGFYSARNPRTAKVIDSSTIELCNKFPKYVKTFNGYIGAFSYLDFGEFPVYRFEGGERIADSWELAHGSNNREDLRNGKN